MPDHSLNSWFDLTGKSAIVTGAGRGIGQACALVLARAGAKVLITDLQLSEARETLAQITNLGGEGKALQANASKLEEVDMVIQTTLSTFGSLDILINNAGIFPLSPVLEITPAAWIKVMSTNLDSVFFYSQAAARQMIAAGHGGKIINIASIDGIQPTGNLAHYNASKGGVIMLTKALARELGPHRINVNAVAPGGINTPGSQAMLEQSITTTGLTPEQITAPFEARIPLGRFGEPDDVAGTVLFLASEAASYITGCVIPVDGGYLVS